ncbi:hypothetical protein NIES4074_64040 (plasmid) [Cylindrospermum sp. NIES-4074]|nr:hypothetical protein NIES4074_64040 [Cylindrospermum sp. NIES-4074]
MIYGDSSASLPPIKLIPLDDETANITDIQRRGIKGKIKSTLPTE